KYKADRREALRKLEQTEANLLRLADVIREIKRQIISLQRQAGKAKRYQSLQERLRSLDLFHARNRLTELDSALRTLEVRRASLVEREEAAQEELRQREDRMARLRAEIEAIEKDLEETRESLAQSRAERNRALETIRVNEERIQELTGIAERDSRDAESATAARERHRAEGDRLQAGKTAADERLREAETLLETHTAVRREMEARVEQSERALHAMRSEQMELDRRLSQRQAELSRLDARERETTLRRERLAAEKSQLEHALEQFQTRTRAAAERIAGLREGARAKSEALENLNRARIEGRTALTELRQTLADVRAREAGRRAELESLQRSENAAVGFASGARNLIVRAEKDPDAALLGPLARHVTAEPGYESALQAVLRPWLDSLLVADGATAFRLVDGLRARAEGSATLFAAAGPEETAVRPSDGPGEPLLSHVRISEEARAAVGS
ncbi:MAG: hypothetical protein U1E27_03420, partial [Kiritimatiellia bacterium]|nr:hypothetical protein [Kiritimatiellia bacterium]